MNRNSINFILDVISFLVMFLVILTGLIIHFILPPGGGRGHALTLWSMNRHQIGEVHFYLAIALIVLMVVHVAMHWEWVCIVAKKACSSDGAAATPAGRRILYGVFFLIILAGICVSLLLWMKSQVTTTPQDQWRGYGMHSIQ